MNEAVLFVFSSTQETLQAEAICEEAQLGGALVLKPKNMIGNCGLALQVNATDSDALLYLLSMRHMVPAGVFSSIDSDRWEPLDSE